eukprot:2477359-Prymnesium_polylepis.1
MLLQRRRRIDRKCRRGAAHHARVDPSGLYHHPAPTAKTAHHATQIHKPGARHLHERAARHRPTLRGDLHDAQPLHRIVERIEREDVRLKVQIVLPVERECQRLTTSPNTSIPMGGCRAPHEGCAYHCRICRRVPRSETAAHVAQGTQT